MAFWYQSVATVFWYIPSNMVNVDGVLNEHAVFLVLVNRFEKSLPNGPELLGKV